MNITLNQNHNSAESILVSDFMAQNKFIFLTFNRDFSNFNQVTPLICLKRYIYENKIFYQFCFISSL